MEGREGAGGRAVGVCSVLGLRGFEILFCVVTWMSNTLFSVDTKKKYRYRGLQGDSLFKAQNFLLWPATHYNSNEPSTIEGKYASRFLYRVFFPPLWSPVITAGRWSIWGVGESVHCIFTFSENATCLLHQCILFLIKCLLQNRSPCAKAWFTNSPPTPPLRSLSPPLLLLSLFPFSF